MEKKFRLDFLRNPWWQPNETVVIGVSGGLDSMALLAASVNLAQEFPVQLIVGHVNYKLRGMESDQEQRLVETFCKERGLVVEVADGSNIRHMDRNLQNAARLFRQHFFRTMAKKHGGKTIFLAHQKEDQVETILLKLLRGSGIGGLTGMREERVDRWGFCWQRPLLQYSRETLARWVEQNQIPFLEDSSNAKTQYLRNRVRHELIPLLKTMQPAIAERILSLQKSAFEIQEELRVAGSQLFERWATEEPDRILLPRPVLLKAPQGVRRFVLGLAYEKVSHDIHHLQRDHYEQMDTILLSNQPVLEYPLPHGIRFQKKYEEISIECHCNT